MHWRVKGLIQKTLSVVPGGVALNDRLQRSVGGLRDFDGNVRAKVINDWVVLMQHLSELGIPLQDKTLVEIGTGWYPTLPVCFHLAGAQRVITYDLTRHLDRALTGRMLAALEKHLPAIAEAGDVTPETIEERYHQLWNTTPAPAPALSAIDYRAPADATATGLPDASVDIVFSNSVFEHVPRTVIAGLMQESARILKPGGVSVHSVNCGDHYAYFDRNISFGNYYRYPEDKWRFWNNDLQYQNRLRPSDFLGLAEAAGLEIALAKWKPRPDLMATLSTLTIAPEFRDYPMEELACTSIDFVAQKTGDVQND